MEGIQSCSTALLPMTMRSVTCAEGDSQRRERALTLHLLLSNVLKSSWMSEQSFSLSSIIQNSRIALYSSFIDPIRMGMRRLLSARLRGTSGRNSSSCEMNQPRGLNCATVIHSAYSYRTHRIESDELRPMFRQQARLESGKAASFPVGLCKVAQLK